jgi:RNA polymerase sigma-70 factor (ECF subfamily)
VSPRRSANERAAQTHAVVESDADLLRRLAEGDIGALGALYDRHHASVHRFVARATSDAEDVDDLVHATFLEAAKSAARYDGRVSSRPWLVGIAAQLLRRRRRAFGRLFEIFSSVRRSLSSHVDPRAALAAKNDVERALATLSETKREAFLMAEVEGMSCEEIARVLDVPIGTVWTRLHAARRELRQALGDSEEGPR